MELLKLLSTHEIVAQLVNFFLLFILLRVFLWKKMFAVLEARRERVSGEFTKIEDAKKEIEKIKADYSAKVGEIDRLAREKLQEAVENGGRLAGEIRTKAQEEARKTFESAKADIQAELARVKEGMRAEIVNLTIAATKNIIQEKLSEEDDKRLVEEFLKQVDGTK
jgi:F-type H+-transporting ATPase subunit b